ncbi:MAG: GAF domain-containing protein, partial [Candidatus Hodarchaeales archaeon]
MTKQQRKEIRRRDFKQGAVLRAINRVFREALLCETSKEVGEVCLSVAEELTGSKFGFIGEINQDGLFDTIALSNPGWVVCKMPKKIALTWLVNMKIRGIWGNVLRSKESIIVNDPASHPDSIGIPEGHPKLYSFMGVPLKQGGKTFGMIA